MKRIVALMAALLAGLALPASAQDEGFGIGVIIGEPTGLSLKKWVSRTAAIDGAIAWAFDPNTSFHVHADYLIHDYDLVKPDVGALPLYAGIGARLKFQDERRGRHRDSRTRTGVRIPLGMNYHFAQAPVDLFLEIVPILDLTPRTDVSLNAAIGARYFFR